MNKTHPLLRGVITGTISGMLVLGGLTVSLVESAFFPPLPMNPTNFPHQPGPTREPSPSIEESTPEPSSTPQPTTTPGLAADCAVPTGWQQITVQAGDTIESLANLYRTTVDALLTGICLPSEVLMPGGQLYVPIYSPTPGGETCTPESGWILYNVQEGDTLFSLSIAYQTTVEDLQRANCLGSSTTIQAGAWIYVPDVPPFTLPHSPTPTGTLSPSPTPTFTPSTTPSPTGTASAAPSFSTAP